MQVMLEGAIDPLVGCLSSKCKSLQLQSTAAAALSDIAKHGPSLAARVAEAGTGPVNLTKSRPAQAVQALLRGPQTTSPSSLKHTQQWLRGGLSVQGQTSRL